jgi:hypothetical protein
MTKLCQYRSKLKELDDWGPFLLKNSGLPGPRGNLELAQAVAELAQKSQLESFLGIPITEAPENSPQVFLVFCGVTALGKMAARGEHTQFARLRAFASDPRWRVREAVAVALQYVGDVDMTTLFLEIEGWISGNAYEKRAAAAALAEPRLLQDPHMALKVLRILDEITSDIASGAVPRDESFKVLRQSMGYCWSVAMAAFPEAGKPLMEKWLASADPDVRWIMKENLRKNRLSKVDERWVQKWQRKLEKLR